jgi:hypothetical protein
MEDEKERRGRGEREEREVGPETAALRLSSVAPRHATLRLHTAPQRVSLSAFETI